MKPIFRLRDGEGSRSGLVVTLLMASLVLAAILAWQAVDTARSHRATAEGVLRDYASLAAGEFARRAIAEVGFRSYYPVITALGGLPGSAQPPVPEEIALDPRAAGAANLVLRTFRLDAEGELHLSDPLPGDLTAMVRAELIAAAAGPPGKDAFDALHVAFEGEHRLFVHAASGGVRVGFEVALDRLGPSFQRALDLGPLLPPTLGTGELANEDLSLAVYDPIDGRQRFRAGGYEAPALAAEVPFGADYGGIFEGMRVRASIDPGAASRLVIGGLPYSRIPLLVLLLLLTVGFVIAGILQLRRERALAGLRSEFVSRVSHELRTPLTQIRMFAETLLLGRVRTDADHRRSLEIIDREARRLSHLVENILQFSRGERGALQIDPRRRELAPLVLEVLEGFEPLARRCDARIESDVPPGLWAKVDEDAARQILLNLVDNAVKYGPSGQRVRVGAASQGAMIRLWVEDQGPGIPEDERQRVWQRFHRMPRERNAAVPGTGIGLSVVRELVALHGGRCLVEGADGGGARFIVELPAAPAGEELPAVTPASASASPAEGKP